VGNKYEKYGEKEKENHGNSLPNPKDKYTTPASLVIMLYTKCFSSDRDLAEIKSPVSTESFFVVFR
jgi:hypothetical protein